jgi:TatA/E family protein of Tat protein translocase
MPFNIQGPELILILIIALIVIGPGKLPDVGAALGRSIREFRKAATDVKDATALDAPAARPTTPAAPPAASAAPAPTPATGEGEAPAPESADANRPTV